MTTEKFYIYTIKGQNVYPSDRAFNESSSTEMKRPLLTLVRPTPTSSPAPEKRKSKSEPKEPSSGEEPSESKKEKTKENKDERSADKSGGSEPEPSPDTSPVATTSTSKAETESEPTPAPARNVTWGENETKHYEVESPYETKDDPIATSMRSSEKEEKPKMSPSRKASAWGAVKSAFISGAAAAAVA